MDIAVYQKNRRRIPAASLLKYDGMWVAFSSDGCCVVASGRSFENLQDDIARKQLNAEELGLEHLVLDDVQLGGAELF
jgi:hypothetical protein